MSVLATRLMTEPCEIIIRTEDGAPDRYGNPTDTETIHVTRCYAEQRSTVAAGPEQQILQGRWKMTFPPETPIDGWAAVKLGTRTFEVIGFPWYVRNPRTGAISHVEADLETSE